MAVSGAFNLILFLLDSISGAPKNINKNDGKKVKRVATLAPIKPVENNSFV